MEFRLSGDDQHSCYYTNLTLRFHQYLRIGASEFRFGRRMHSETSNKAKENISDVYSEVLLKKKESVKAYGCNAL